ncbi:MAG TPA: hypothetical protein VN726_06050 [Hanamia sp.]|nr:hypothetical protein [Hanamia sp.]
MKKFKISMIAVFAIVMGIAASAFTSSPVNSNMKPLTTTWFQFMGSDPTNVADVQNYQNYSYVNGLPCSGSSRICAVQVDGPTTPGAQPSSAFSSTLKSELQNVILHGNSYGDISKKP